MNKPKYIDIQLRLLDIFLSTILILTFLPLVIATALLVRLTIGKPVMYKQVRPGLFNKLFVLYKFRTMSNATDEYGELLPDAKRLSFVGKFIRKLSLDELPQLFNVIKGDMSLVGPRPLLVEYLPLYNADQKLRHLVRPGITGLAQVNGRNAIDWDEKFKYDIYYVQNRSVFQYIKILFITAYSVVFARNINSSDLVTMEKFSGNEEDDIHD